MVQANSAVFQKKNRTKRLFPTYFRLSITSISTRTIAYVVGRCQRATPRGLPGSAVAEENRICEGNHQSSATRRARDADSSVDRGRWGTLCLPTGLRKPARAIVGLACFAQSHRAVVAVPLRGLGRDVHQGRPDNQ